MLILIWVVVAILAAIGEMLTLDLFLALVSAAAIFTALFALLLPGALQVVIFAGLSVGGIVFTRPAIKHMLGVGQALEIDGAPRRSSVVGRRGKE
jgi:membrane protein implicated in regulation of membrane protease activity